MIYSRFDGNWSGSGNLWYQAARTKHYSVLDTYIIQCADLKRISVGERLDYISGLKYKHHNKMSDNWKKIRDRPYNSDLKITYETNHQSKPYYDWNEKVSDNFALSCTKSWRIGTKTGWFVLCICSCESNSATASYKCFKMTWKCVNWQLQYHLEKSVG